MLDDACIVVSGGWYANGVCSAGIVCLEKGHVVLRDAFAVIIVCIYFVDGSVRPK